MHYYGMGKSTIDEMNFIEIKGWMEMIPAIQEKFERKEEAQVPTPENSFIPL